MWQQAQFLIRAKKVKFRIIGFINFQSNFYSSKKGEKNFGECMTNKFGDKMDPAVTTFVENDFFTLDTADLSLQ